MTTANNAATLLARALRQTGAAIGQVRPDQSGLPTPCPAFDVRKLVNHTVFDVRTFASMVNGGKRGSPDEDLIGMDWPAAFQAASEALLGSGLPAVPEELIESIIARDSLGLLGLA